MLEEHVVVQGCDLDLVLAQGRIAGLTSFAVNTRSPVIAALSSPVG